MVKTTNAQCVPGTGALSKDFNKYISECGTPNDTSRTNNLFTQDNFTESITTVQALATDLILSNTNASTLQTNSSTDQTNRIKSLTSQQTKLQDELDHLTRETQAAERGFLDIVTTETPTSKNYPTLQDISLGIFLLGWLILGLSLVFVKMFGPQGNIRGGLIVLVLFFFISMVVYSIMKQVA
jgi:hypothetical protein